MDERSPKALGTDEVAVNMPQSDIIQRKSDHITLALKQGQALQTGNDFDKITLVHDALPELDFDAIDISCQFLGFAMKRPFLISSMTGGPSKAEKINCHLAEAACELGIAMGVGSQRVAVEANASAGLARRVRLTAKGVPLFANLGAAQLRERSGKDMVRRAVDSLEADALILHLNPLQELIQPGGDRNWSRVADGIAAVVVDINIPVIVKEVGFGLSAKTARKLAAAGVSALDVAGRGGTDFCQIEAERAAAPPVKRLATAFKGWGVSTPNSILQVQNARLPIIASGGIRHGVDAAKALALGASIVGQAGQLLPAALSSTRAVIDHFVELEDGLRAACLLTGSANVSALAGALDT